LWYGLFLYIIHKNSIGLDTTGAEISVVEAIFQLNKEEEMMEEKISTEKIKQLK
jgi:hypothetical protein